MNERPLVEELSDPSVSAYRRYLGMFVGSDSLAALIRYELVTGILGAAPGAAGYLLRSRSYPWLLKRTGRGTVFGRGVVLRCPGRIALGSGVLIDDHVVLDAKGATSAITLGDRVLLGRNSILSCNDSTLTMGDFISVGPFCFLVSRSHLTIGSNVAIGAGTHLLGGGHVHDDPDTAVIHQARVSKGITIEDNAWIGIGAKILDGVTVGRNSIVGAGAVVSKDVAPWTVVLGNPARMVDKRKREAVEA